MSLVSRLTRIRARHGRLRHRLAVPVLAAALVAGVAPPASADNDPIFLGWPYALAARPLPYQPSSADECAAGRLGCVDKTIRRMNSTVTALSADCNHRAVFALAYLRTTQEYERSVTTPDFYSDDAFMNYYDSVFASYYFEANDSWVSGASSDVPAAWKIAFTNADDHDVSGLGDLLLGMNAHVNRDLPFVLASIGLTSPDGTSRKPDHDKVNEFLNRVVTPLLDEEAQRYDPQMDNAKTPFGISYTALMQLLVGWREGAWRNAERLVAAPDAAARAVVARQIENSAVTTAQVIQAAQSYLPPVTSSTARDAYCAAHG